MPNALHSSFMLSDTNMNSKTALPLVIPQFTRQCWFVLAVERSRLPFSVIEMSSERFSKSKVALTSLPPKRLLENCRELLANVFLSISSFSAFKSNSSFERALGDERLTRSSTLVSSIAKGRVGVANHNVSLNFSAIANSRGRRLNNRVRLRGSDDSGVKEELTMLLYATLAMVVHESRAMHTKKTSILQFASVPRILFAFFFCIEDTVRSRCEVSICVAALLRLSSGLCLSIVIKLVEVSTVNWKRQATKFDAVLILSSSLHTEVLGIKC